MGRSPKAIFCAEDQKLYYVWWEMKRRCLDPRTPQFKDYGGRGITVDQRWLDSFASFKESMGPRPRGGLLDRINNNGPYGPNNCKWSTRKEQNSNRRNCIYVDLDGEKVTLAEACRRRGISYKAILKRVIYGKWDIAEALAVPVGGAR